MNKGKKVLVDYSKMVKCFKEKGISVSDVGVKMGYHSSFIPHIKSTEYISLAHAIQIETMFGIKPDDYAPDPEPPKAEIKPTPAIAAQPMLSLTDKLALDKVTEAITTLKYGVNDQRNEIKALTEAVTHLANGLDAILKVFGDPMQLYRTIFIPMYNGIKAAEIDHQVEQVERAQRRIDGTPLPRK